MPVLVSVPRDGDDPGARDGLSGPLDMGSPRALARVNPLAVVSAAYMLDEQQMRRARELRREADEPDPQRHERQ